MEGYRRAEDLLLSCSWEGFVNFNQVNTLRDVVLKMNQKKGMAYCIIPLRIT